MSAHPCPRCGGKIDGRSHTAANGAFVCGDCKEDDSLNRHRVTSYAEMRMVVEALASQLAVTTAAVDHEDHFEQRRLLVVDQLEAIERALRDVADDLDSLAINEKCRAGERATTTSEAAE